MSRYLWSRPDSIGVQYCDSDEIVSVRDFGTYAELSTLGGENLEYFATAQLAREAGERHLEEHGVMP